MSTLNTLLSSCRAEQEPLPEGERELAEGLDQHVLPG